MSYTYEHLLVESCDEHVVLVRFNRPHRANALNTGMAEDIYHLWSRMGQDEQVRCIVLTGVEERAFCAGADLKDRHGMSVDEWHQQHQVFEQAMCAISSCDIPTIAAVNGAAIGGGLEIALACDFIFAVPHARFAFSEVKLGIIPGLGGTQRLVHAVGIRRAKQLVLSGIRFSAKEAVLWGLVNELHEAGQLLDAARETARQIAQNAPLAVRSASRAIDASMEAGLKEGLAYELAAYRQLIPTKDRLEGIAAFNEKRTPDFKGH